MVEYIMGDSKFSFYIVPEKPVAIIRIAIASYLCRRMAR
jgi:hypothetical protein